MEFQGSIVVIIDLSGFEAPAFERCSLLTVQYGIKHSVDWYLLIFLFVPFGCNCHSESAQ